MVCLCSFTLLVTLLDCCIVLQQRGAVLFSVQVELQLYDSHKYRMKYMLERDKVKPIFNDSVPEEIFIQNYTDIWNNANY